MKAVLSCACAVLAASATSGPEKLPNISAALSYSLVDARTNRPFALSNFAGKYKAIYIDFYASWCPDCKRALPEVRKLHDRYSGKDVLFLSVDVWDSYYRMKAHLEANDLPWLVVHDPEERGGQGITSVIGINNIPTVIILDGKTLEEKGFFVDEKSVHGASEARALDGLGV